MKFMNRIKRSLDLISHYRMSRKIYNYQNIMECQKSTLVFERIRYSFCWARFSWLNQQNIPKTSIAVKLTIFSLPVHNYTSQTGLLCSAESVQFIFQDGIACPIKNSYFPSIHQLTILRSIHYFCYLYVTFSLLHCICFGSCSCKALRVLPMPSHLA